MGFSRLFKKKFCVALSLLMILACGGGGGNDAPPAPAPNIYLAQSSLDFAGVVLDNTTDRTLVIKNTGNANLKIGQILPLNSPFSIATDACSLRTLSPSQTCSLGIRFSPTSQGSSSATLAIPSDDPDSSTVNVSLSGVGYGLNVWINKVDAAGCPGNMSVDVTVTDPISGSLLGLGTGDFRLWHNGQLQNITVSGNVYPSPVSLVLALDWSGSLDSIRPDIELAATTMIAALNDELPERDWAAICKFTDVIDFHPLTDNLIEATVEGKSNLNTYIISFYASGAGTYLYDAVFQSVVRAVRGPTNKRVVIVLSDGVEDPGTGTGSTHTLDQVIAYATENDISIFTIYYVDEARMGVNYGKPEIMQRLASETGGQYFNALNANIGDIFQQISNTLSNKYTLTYTASPSTCTGTISVRADWTGLYGQDSISFP